MSRETASLYLSLLFIALALSLSFLSTSEIVSAAFAYAFVLGLAFLFERRAEDLRFVHLWLQGSLSLLIALSWIPIVLIAFAEWSALPRYLTWIVFCGTSAIQLGLLVPLRKLLHRGIVQRLQLSLPIAWGTLELFFPTIMPWSLGHTQVGIPILRNLAAVLGVEAIGMLLLWWAALLVSQNISWFRKTVFIASSLVALGTCALFSGYREIDIGAALSVGLVQNNLHSPADYAPGRQAENLELQRKLTKDLLSAGPVDLIIWPESSVGFDYRTTETALDRGAQKDPLPSREAPLIFGGQTLLRAFEWSKRLYFNSAFVLEPSGKLQRYDKRILIPFAERVPLQEALPRRIREVFKQKFDLAAGNRNQQNPELALSGGRGMLRLGISICYEDLWVHSNFESNANLLVSLSNDSWFSGTAAPMQHDRAARFQAILFGRYLLRATSTGRTSVTGPSGEVLLSLPDDSAHAAHIGGIRALAHTTPFSRYGRAPLMLIILCVHFIAVLVGAQKRSV